MWAGFNLGSLGVPTGVRFNLSLLGRSGALAIVGGPVEEGLLSMAPA